MELGINDICQIVNGRQIGSDGLITSISIDSRLITAGSLFVAIKGDNHDGHNFLPQAMEAGARAAVISQDNVVNGRFEGKSFIVVDNTLDALQKLAAYYRSTFKIPVIAVTGSVGKTTTRDLIASCLQSKYKVLKSYGNFNNDIGVPLSIFRLNKEYEAAVFELAMRARGEISRLASIAQPDYAVITNIEKVHLETLGSLDNIARAKCEVLENIKDQGFALLNGDSEILMKTAQHYPCRKYTFGYNKGCDFCLERAIVEKNQTRLITRLQDNRDEFIFPLPAPKLAHDVLAAVGMACLLGVSVDSIKASLAYYNPTGNRLKILDFPEGGCLIDDTYNANPLSMIAALETARGLKGKGRLVAILGDMFELGTYEVPGHLEVGTEVFNNKVDMLITVGKAARYISLGAEQAGVKDTVHFNNKDDCLEFILANVHKTDTILVKASRGMQMETLIAGWLSAL